MPWPSSPYGRRAALIALSLLATFGVLRASLLVNPNADFDLFGYNIHHLFTGLLVITATAVPLAIGGAPARARTILVIGLGVGLGLALDEWVYLIATDGSNASYLLPVSFWGGLIVVGLAAAYAALFGAWSASSSSASEHSDE